MHSIQNDKSLFNICTLKGHLDKIWNLAWHPTGKYLASCSGDKSIKIWSISDTNSAEYETINTIENAHSKTIRSIAWSPDGNSLATASFDSTIRIWQNKDQEFQCVSTLEGHENEVKSIAWNTKGNYLASCSRDKTVWIWEQDENSEYCCNSVLNGHSQDVKMVKWLGNRDILLSCGYDDVIKIWVEGEDEWECQETLQGHDSTVWCIDTNKDGTLIISSSDDCTIKIWQEVKKGVDEGKIEYECIKTLADYHLRSVYSCSLNYDGTILATAGGDDTINLFSIDNSKLNLDSEEKSDAIQLITQLRGGHITDINCVTFHPYLNVLATGSDDKTIKIWVTNYQKNY